MLAIGRSRVFRRAEEEVESDTRHIGERFLGRRRGHGVMVEAVRRVEEEQNEGDGDGLDPRWWWVAFVVEFVHTAKAEIHATVEGCQSGVRGPQIGERLTNRAEDVTNVLS